jgi:hypothetical protein
VIKKIKLAAALRRRTEAGGVFKTNVKLLCYFKAWPDTNSSIHG